MLIGDVIWGNIMEDNLRLLSVICAYSDNKYENLLIEMVLPEVEKENISLKSLKTNFCES
jgi:hypothetical protein